LRSRTAADRAIAGGNGHWTDFGGFFLKPPKRHFELTMAYL
jgi:hypothetical protein